MVLTSYYNKKVKILDSDGIEHVGKVTDYIYPEDNESGKASIIIFSTNGDYIEFYEDDIDKIEIM